MAKLRARLETMSLDELGKALTETRGEIYREVLAVYKQKRTAAAAVELDDFLQKHDRQP